MKIAKTSLLSAGVLALVATSCSTTSPKPTSSMSAAPTSHAIEDLVQYASPMCGTGAFPDVPAGDNNLFPGAVAPFGMIQWSPDTGAGTKPGGYAYYDTQISGFSLDHLSGAGCPDGGNFSFMPILGAGEPPNGSRVAFATTFSHANETAKPGYYAVALDNGIKVELTATTRTGFGRFTFPAGKTATLAVNAASDVNRPDDSSIFINPDAREISGWSIGGYFCQGRSRERDKRTIYFCAVFDKPFSGYGTWSGAAYAPNSTNGSDTASGAFLSFDTSQTPTVMAKVAISYVSIANARANIEAESPVSHFASSDFDNAVQAASDNWNAWLNKIQVSGGTTNDMKTFYSMLYHAFIGPTACSDANGDYMGYDGQVHNTAGRVQYANFSGWDIYRSEAQFIAMLAPKEASDMAESLLNDYQQGGAFPRWGVTTEDSGVMMGDPAAPIIADFYAFGATNFDTDAALAGLLNAATNPAVYAPRSRTHERDGLADYIKLGYVPEHGEQGGYGPVSMTLEYDSADFALAELAAALHDPADAQLLLQHAQNWHNLYNPDTGYIQLKRRNGEWAPGFTNNVGSYDHAGTVYVEGTAGQYLWMVPFNYKGLAEAMGGQDTAVKRLDDFFTKLNVGDRGPDAAMAWLGNEPCLETPWIYDFWGAPYKTQSVVRRAMNELYSGNPIGYAGNDDLGEMSSWYLFAALGMYPELPGSDILVLGSPLFPKAVIHTQTGDITITATGAGKDSPFVQSLTVNGQPWTKPWLRFSDIKHNGTMDYTLSTTPNTTWGADPSDAPPSYNGGSEGDLVPIP
ncbi:MAG TPA: GH92 family glycosyl hydrolase [Candidatus Sulfotelmatobacter sp.]|nr:GH92 family glycosyl hydrolase [Candidatus Sulfotelmatobacter sp.]